MLSQLPSSHDNGQSMVMYSSGMSQLPSSHDNGQSMVMYSSGMKHAPSVVIVS